LYTNSNVILNFTKGGTFPDYVSDYNNLLKKKLRSMWMAILPLSDIRGRHNFKVSFCSRICNIFTRKKGRKKERKKERMKERKRERGGKERKGKKECCSHVPSFTLVFSRAGSLLLRNI